MPLASCIVPCSLSLAQRQLRCVAASTRSVDMEHAESKSRRSESIQTHPDATSTVTDFSTASHSRRSRLTSPQHVTLSSFLKRE